MEEALNSVTAHPAADVDRLDHLASDNLDIDLTLSACEYERQGQLWTADWLITVDCSSGLICQLTELWLFLAAG